LVAALDAMEAVPAAEFREMIEPVRRAERLAVELGRDDLAMRARLLDAASLLRDGHTVDAGRIAHQVHVWATEHHDDHLLSRTHRELSVFFRQIGDLANSLAHAVQSVTHTAENVAPGIRARHLLTLGAVLDESGSTDEGARRFHEALDIATATGDGELALYTLNDLAYTAYEHGDEPAARDYVERMRTAHTRLGGGLSAHHLDTIARVEMMGARYEQAEAALAPVLAGTIDGDLFTEGDALAECLLTAAEAQRRRGHLDRAEETLNRAGRVCDKRGLAAVAARVREQRAQLLAESGRYREAYQEHRAFHAQARALQSAQSEARARALQAVFESDEARRSSDRFRELAHRDPLTGLHNRRYVNERLPALLHTATDDRTPLSAALLDLDHFKQVNDTLSHDTGDRVLRLVAELLTAAVSAPALAARMGGEEFLLVFPGTGAVEAVRRCEQLRRSIRSHPWQPVTGELAVTTSIGVTTVLDGRISPSALLSQADRNLYTAKRTGRNRVVGD
ncbi:MAG TPA: GGDEF domain-containing protein, partial [Catenuloplanes sp.]